VLQNRDTGVIALGGGTWTIPANRTLVALHDCQTVWLDVPFAVCWQRISENTGSPPLAPITKRLTRDMNHVARFMRWRNNSSVSATDDSVERIVETDRGNNHE
jgi:shikimate kinase